MSLLSGSIRRQGRYENWGGLFISKIKPGYIKNETGKDEIALSLVSSILQMV